MDRDFLDESFDAEIDLTPLIDVIFMLLLFFILASTFSAPVLQVLLPAAETAVAVESDPSRLVFSIDENGSLHHQGLPLESSALPELLAETPDGPVELRVDRTAPFDAFVQVMDPVRASGRTDVLITTQPD